MQWVQAGTTNSEELQQPYPGHGLLHQRAQRAHDGRADHEEEQDRLSAKAVRHLPEDGAQEKLRYAAEGIGSCKAARGLHHRSVPKRTGCLRYEQLSSLQGCDAGARYRGRGRPKHQHEVLALRRCRSIAAFHP